MIKILKYDIEVKDICGHFKLGVLLGHKIYNRKWREFYSSLVEDILVGDVLNKTKACALTHLYPLRQIDDIVDERASALSNIFKRENSTFISYRI